MSNQGHIWEKEYQNPKLLTKEDKPQADTLRFFKFLKKERRYKLTGRTILDLGAGTGRNANYLAGLGNQVIAFEISKKALEIAKQRARKDNLIVGYRLADIGKPYDLRSESIDLILDVTSSNSLDEKGREIYLKETSRVLKSPNSSGEGGYLFVRALSKEGDKNAKNLLKNSSAKEPDTYFMPDIGLTERVFSRADFIKTYEPYFKILKLDKKSGYASTGGRLYKRNYWLAYMQK